MMIKGLKGNGEGTFTLDTGTATGTRHVLNVEG